MPQIEAKPSGFICCVGAIKRQGVVVTDDGLLWISVSLFAFGNRASHSIQGRTLQVLINNFRMLLLIFILAPFIN